MKLVMKFLGLLISPRWDRNSSQPYHAQLVVRRFKSLSSYVLSITFKFVLTMKRLNTPLI